MEREDQSNNLLADIGLAGAGATAMGFAGLALLKNRARRQQAAKSTGGPRGGQGGTQTVDLNTGQLPERAKPTRSQAYENAARRNPQDFDFTQYSPKGGSPDIGTVTDQVTGEIYRRGGDDAYYQQNRNLQTTQRVEKGNTPLLPGRSGGMETGKLSNLLQNLNPESNNQNPLFRESVKPTSQTNPVTQSIVEGNKELGLQKPSGNQSAVEAKPDRAQQLIDEYTFNVDRENRRVDKVNREIDALREGKAMRVIDEIRKSPDTLVEVQETVEPRVAVNAVESVDTAQDQMAAKVARTVQRDPDENLAQFDLLQDKAEQQGQSPAQAALTAEEKLARDRELVQSDPQQFLKEFNIEFPEEAQGVKAVDNIRQRRDLASPDDPFASRESIESVLTGSEAEVDRNMRGRSLRGGKIDEAGDIRYQDSSGQDFYSADTGVKAKQAEGSKYEQRARLQNQLNAASDDELASLVQRSSDPKALLQARQQGRMASEVLRQRAVANMDAGRDVSAQQAMALSRGRKSVDASEKIRGQQSNRPAAPTGPEADVARSMETMRRGMEVEPSELPPVIDDVRAAWGDEKGQTVAAVNAPTVYTGAAREAAGPVLFTGKSRAESVVRGPDQTGTVDTTTGRYATVDNPDRIGTVYNVAGTPENKAQFVAIEQNAQDFLADAITGGLTPKAAPAVEAPSSPVRTQPVVYTEAETYPLPQVVEGLPGIEASQRLGSGSYTPGRDAPAPISPFIGEMSGGTVMATTPGAPEPGRDIGRVGASNLSANKPIRERTMSLVQLPDPAGLQGPAPIGPLTQSPGLTKIGRMVQQQSPEGFDTYQNPQLTGYGRTIAYPRMSKYNTAIRPEARLINEREKFSGPLFIRQS